MLFLMWPTVKIVLAVLTVLLGTVHILCAIPIAELDIDTLWFIGSGMAILFAGFINLITVYSPQKIARTIAVLTNILLVGLFALAAAILEGIQVWIGMALFLVQGVIFAIRNSK